MRLHSDSLRASERVPPANAMGVTGASGPVPGPNKSPHLAWSDVPPGTRSFAVLCIDIDAPDKTNANRTDYVIDFDDPTRADFFHWILIDVPAGTTSLAEGLDSDGVTPKGKPPGKTPHGVRGINSYKEWFGDDATMGGDYGGYDGPWPPFNDEREHRYVFSVHALSVATLGLKSPRGPEVRAAIEGKVLAEASLTVTYALNAAARPAR